MANAAVLIGGYLKKITDFSLIGFNHSNGFVARFTFNKISYIHVNQLDFRKEDQNTTYATAGYYNEAEFLKYRVANIPSDVISQIRLMLDRLPNGDIGDTVKVRKLKVEAPYTDFCKVNDISWVYTGGSILKDDLSIAIPQEPISKVVTTDIPVNDVARGFYQRNIKLINSTNISHDEIPTAAYLITMTAVQISNIQKDIFPLFSNDPSFNDYIHSQNLEWTLTDIFINPFLVDFQQYLNNITTFYNSIYANQVFISKSKKESKLYWFAYVLSVQGLSVMPASDKISVLKLIAEGTIAERSRMIETSRLTPTGQVIFDQKINEEAFVLRIVSSVKVMLNQIDDFLNRLLFRYYINKIVDHTLVEILYGGMDDNRIKRFTAGLINDSDNQTAFVQLMLDIWNISKYNPYYKSPDYTLPISQEGVFPESYFMTNNGKYYSAEKSPAILAYSSSASMDNTSITRSEVNFGFKIKSATIEVDKWVTVTHLITSGTDLIGSSADKEYQHYGTYHLYQPVSLIGYKSDRDIIMPNQAIPIFFLYFIEGIVHIKNVDFATLLFIDIALNFTGIGEIADFKYLGYLKYISKFSRLEGLAAEESVLFWPAVSGVNKTIQFSAGAALSISNYLHNTSSDPDIIKFTGKLNSFLGLLLLGSISLDPIIKGKVILSANDLIDDYNHLLSIGKETNLSEDAINQLISLSKLDDLIGLMKTKIANLPLIETPTIGAKYNVFGTQDQFDFLRHFYNLKSTDNAWNVLNKQYLIDDGPGTRTLVDIWHEFIYLKEERKFIDALESFNRFKYLRNYEFKHIWVLEVTKGGHRTIYVTTDLNDASKLWKIVSTDSAINTSIPMNLRTKIYNINGHIYYENLWRFNPNLNISDPKVQIINALGVSKKAKHFVVNPLWDEQRLLEEMSYANAHKVEYQRGTTIVKTVLDPVEEILYNSTFSDGTKVQLVYREKDIDPSSLSNDLIYNHLSLFSILKP